MMWRVKVLQGFLALCLGILLICIVTVLLRDNTFSERLTLQMERNTNDHDHHVMHSSVAISSNTSTLLQHPSSMENIYRYIKHRVTPAKNASSPCGDLQFRPCCWPLTALASFPGSGNTWTRHLMQQATGFYTGDIYTSPLNKRDGWAGEGRKDKRTLNVKTHLKPSARGQPRYERAILLIRHLTDAVLAEFNREMAGPVGRVPGFVYDSDKWKARFKQLSQEWAEFNLAWLNFKGDVYILRYEELKTNLKVELQRVCSFLDVDVSKSRLHCVYQNQEGNYHRPVSNIDPFTPAMKLVAERLSNQVERAILEREHQRGEETHTKTSPVPETHKTQSYEFLPVPML